MTYFLDFDRTLFDTDSFTPSIVDKPAVSHLKDQILAVASTPRDHTIKGQPGRFELWEALDALCRDGTLTFAPHELSKFVFPDAIDFLVRHGSDSVILSYGHEYWIRSKIESALAGVTLERIVYAHDREKGIALQPLLKTFSAPYVLVDDLASQLDSVKVHCPDVALYEMRRDGKEPSGRHNVIHSLSELP